ncbi:hypothetical protein C2S51_010575 [Perilla frutescens var. frutescens]|nr:hypothetical protein C2S51_010575 [Perilla frutescens var. frutescens]
MRAQNHHNRHRQVLFMLRAQKTNLPAEDPVKVVARITQQNRGPAPLCTWRRCGGQFRVLGRSKHVGKEVETS